MKYFWIFITLIPALIYSQNIESNLVQKEIKLQKDTIIVEKTSIMPYRFMLKDNSNNNIDNKKYKIIFDQAKLIIIDKSLINKKVKIQYKKFPEFLTKTYQALDTNLIVKDINSDFKLYRNLNLKQIKKINLFNGLETKGNITRGITFGNNQDGVLDSNLELQIQGNLSNKVKIRANIIDSNIPVQNNGYTQRLDEFDKIFMEIYTNKWQVIAGDLPFKNTSLKYLQFEKKVQGLSVKTTSGDSIKNKNIYVSGAIVKGKFTSVSFNGQNGNQGPYNIIQLENAHWLIVADSETVFVNGIKVEKGKDKNYIIDYNTAEIYFNPTFPINSTMRITVDFQISDQNYTRFVSFNEVHTKSEKSAIQLSFYNENDLKNNSANQILTQQQIDILTNAGDETTQMVVPSAVPEDYDPDKIQYKKETQNGQDFFVFSNNPNDQLYHVNFNYVGENNGNYNIDQVLATGKIFSFIPPINNEKQGNYEPVIPLIAPNKLQLINLKTSLNTNEKTRLKSELSYSYFDKNLFSNKQDDDNGGFAGHIDINRTLLNNKWKIDAKIYNELISENFKTVQRIHNVEFNRDWNILEEVNNRQNIFNFGISSKKDSVLSIDYAYKNLNIKEQYNGNKHIIKTTGQLKKLNWNSKISILNTNTKTETTSYFLSNNSILFNFKKKWVGSEHQYENNKRKDKITNVFNNLSFKNQLFKTYFGIGNKNKIFSEIGYVFRKNDSIQNNNFLTFEKVNSIYVDSKLIQSKKSSLSLYTNYEINKSHTSGKTKFLNTSIKYRQQLFEKIADFNIEYQTGSGNLPQQDYQFIEVEPGHGYYQWIDYDNDNIKDLDEFEIAAFQDQANYLKIALPTINYIKVNLNKFSSNIAINFSSITKNNKFKRIVSHFSNQTSILTDIKRKRENSFIHLNPFDYKTESTLSLKANFKNSLYFNRGKQKFSTTYTYQEAQNKSVFITGFQTNKINQNIFNFIHLIKKQWLFNTTFTRGNNKNKFETFTQRNFEITKKHFQFNLDFIKNEKIKFGGNIEHKDLNNKLGNNEKLIANTFGVSLNYTNDEKVSVQTKFNWINNKFDGNPNSAVGYQMLEGLKNGKNYTWQLIAQKSINNFLNLNISYHARKSDFTKTIHVGSIQLRAVF
jgi:hypothetical protein